MTKLVLGDYEIVQIMEYSVLYYVYDQKKKYFIDCFGNLLPKGRGFFSYAAALSSLACYLDLLESKKDGGVL